MSLNSSYICRSKRSGLERLTKVSRNRTPFSVNRSPSLMNAAFTASGVVATVGQVRLACTCAGRLVRQSIIGKKMMSSGFLACTLYSRLWTCGMPSLEGKHGSMAPRLAPSLYSSSLV